MPATAPDPLAWAVETLPHYFTDPPAPMHAELLRDLAHGPARLLARVAPRGHAKSTCAALAYTLWCLCHQRRRNIVIITHEASLATQFVRDLRAELEANERILERFGDLRQSRPEPRRHGGDAGRRASAAAGGGRGPGVRPRGSERGRREAGRRRRRETVVRARRGIRVKWSESSFTTSTGITVQGRGAGASFRGTRVGPHRPDLVVCDDIEKDEHVASPEGRRKLERWLRRVVMPALAPDGQLLVLGSILHYDSLLAGLRDPQRWPHWDYKVYRALEARPAADGRFELTALWPGRWPVDKLQEERRRIGTLAFEQEYQANPIDESLRVFRPEWLRRYDPAELEGRAGHLVHLIAVDPATGASGGDFFALWAGSLDPATGVLYTRELTLERIGIVEQVRRIVAAFERWRPVRVGIETVAYQVALRDILEEESRVRGLFMPVVSIRTVANKRARIEGAAPFFENGTFRLPPALDPEVETQFLHFPAGRHDDAPDVCAMAIELARGLRCGGAIEGATAGARRFDRRGAW